jgi:hypothetical protein
MFSRRHIWLLPLIRISLLIWLKILNRTMISDLQDMCSAIIYSTSQYGH